MGKRNWLFCCTEVGAMRTLLTITREPCGYGRPSGIHPRVA